MKIFMFVLHQGLDVDILMSEIASNVTLCYLNDRIRQFRSAFTS